MNARSLGWAAVGVLVGLLAILALGKLNTSAETTQAIREAQVSNHELLDTIQDCTQTGGKCNQRQLEQTAAAVASIGKEAIIRSACGIVISRESDATTAAALSREIGQCIKQTTADLSREKAGR